MSFEYKAPFFPTAPNNVPPELRSYFDQVWSFFQINFSNTGLVMPSLTSAEIALLTNALNGTMVYNTTTNKAMVKENGSFVNIV